MVRPQGLTCNNHQLAGSTDAAPPLSLCNTISTTSQVKRLCTFTYWALPQAVASRNGIAIADSATVLGKAPLMQRPAPNPPLLSAAMAKTGFCSIPRRIFLPNCRLSPHYNRLERYVTLPY